VSSSLFVAHSEERVQGPNIQSLLWDCCRLPTLSMLLLSAAVASHFTCCNPDPRSKIEEMILSQELNWSSGSQCHIEQCLEWPEPLAIIRTMWKRCLGFLFNFTCHQYAFITYWRWENVI